MCITQPTGSGWRAGVGAGLFKHSRRAWYEQISPGHRASGAFVTPTLYNEGNGKRVGEMPEEQPRTSYPGDIRQGLHPKGGGCEAPRNRLS